MTSGERATVFGMIAFDRSALKGKGQRMGRDPLGCAVTSRMCLSLSKGSSHTLRQAERALNLPVSNFSPSVEAR